ncbi:MAG: hypothetical protein JST55_07210 [Bacteroidetes bacterium]|nr:hypothetical protein [Bacteroidota bacterium]
MAPVKILAVLFTLANAGQFALMVKGGADKTRLVRLLEKFHIEFDLFPGFVISILIFVVLLFAIFSFFNHYINYKEHYSSFFRVLICGNLIASIIAVMLNFYLYFL